MATKENCDTDTHKGQNKFKTSSIDNINDIPYYLNLHILEKKIEAI